MLDSSHLLIKNIIINHIFRTLDDVPVDCRLRRVTSRTATLEKVLQGQRADLSGSHMGQKSSGVANVKGPTFEIKMVIMQNLFGPK